MDATGSPELYVRYLDVVRRQPQWAAWKADSFLALDLRPGDRFLDVGCGTGEEVRTAAGTVGPAGLAVGLDYSSAMAREAVARPLMRGSAFLVGDAVRLPFATASFAGCRAERTLQYVAGPEGALAELARVVVPGGRVVVLEPDWDTLVFSTPYEDVSRRLLAYRRDLNPSRTVGRHLPRLAAAAGLAVQSVAGRALSLTDYAVAADTIHFDVDVAAARAAGRLTATEADTWLDSLRAADAIGGFVAMVTILVVVADKPVRATRQGR